MGGEEGRKGERERAGREGYGCTMIYVIATKTLPEKRDSSTLW
jgi:hypothetical protein